MEKFTGNRAPQGTLAAKLLLLFILLLPPGKARAALLFYDGFDYPAGQELGEYSSSTNWSNDKNQFKIVTGSLYYPGLEATLGNRININATMPSLDSVRTRDGAWPKQSSGTLYVSFILRLHSFAEIGTNGLGTSLITVGDTLNNSELFGINLLNDGHVRLGVLKYPSRSSQVSSSAFFASGPGANLFVDGSTTYLIVARYEWREGPTNDRVTLWVNPTALGHREDPENNVATSAGPDGVGSAGRLTLSRGPNVNIDEVRVGESWAEVTPAIERQQHWMVTAAVLALGLVVASFWITQLRRKVRERSAALRAQIAERQRAEQQRLMEQERSRIAHDLHDELGAEITEISMLATRAQGGADGNAEGRRCLEQLTGKTTQMVAKLEEIVWAMDPQYDSLQSLVSYFSFFADRLLELASIKLIIETSEAAASLALEARVRHQLFLVFKEALANVVKHSQATEVRVAVHVRDGRLHVTVADNGCGLGPPDPTSGAHEGLANMRRRMEKLGGQFEINRNQDHGTTVNFSVPMES